MEGIKEIVKELRRENYEYLLKFSQKDNENFLLTFEEKVGYQKWQGAFNFFSLAEGNNNWNCFLSQINLVHYLSNIILADSFQISELEGNYNFKFSYETDFAGRKENLEFYLQLLPIDSLTDNKIDKLFQLCNLNDNHQKCCERERSKMMDTIKILQDKISTLEKKNEDLNHFTYNEIFKLNEINIFYKEEFKKLNAKYEELFKLTSNNRVPIITTRNENGSTPNIPVNNLLGKIFTNPDQSIFTNSNYNKTIEKSQDNSQTNGIKITNVVPINGVLSYKLKIENSPKMRIMIGYGLTTEEGLNGGNYKNRSYMFYLTYGRLFNMGSPISNSVDCKIKNGDFLTVELNLNSKLISLFHNGTLVGSSHNIGDSYSEADLKNLCACVDLKEKGDKITLLD
jgi:hypothetical protein